MKRWTGTSVLLFVGLALTVTLSGCGSGAGDVLDGNSGGDGSTEDIRNSPAITQEASAVIGATGGSVSLKTDNETEFRIDIPAQDLAADTTITIRQPASLPPIPSSQIMAVANHAVEIDMKGQSLPASATITISLPTSDDSHYQCVIMYDNATGQWYVPAQSLTSGNHSIDVLVDSGAVMTIVEVNDNQTGTPISKKLAKAVCEDPATFTFGKDSFSIRNFASDQGPGMKGNCWGFSMFAAWYFVNHRDQPLYSRYPVAVQKAIIQEAFLFQYNLFHKLWNFWMKSEADQTDIAARDKHIVGQIVTQLHLGRPASLALSTDVHFDFSAAGHSVLVYSCTDGQMLVYDSNFPTGPQTIPYNSVSGIGHYNDGAYDWKGFLVDYAGPIVDRQMAGIYNRYTHSPPTITNPAITANLTPNQLGIVTASCTPTADANATIQGVTVDLSPIGGPSAQQLTKGGGNNWSWSGTATPSSSGEKIITFVATDSSSYTASATATVTVSSAAPTPTVTPTPKPTPSGDTVLLQDDFNGTSLDSQKWTWGRQSVTVADGVVTVAQDQTDNGGYLSSQPLTFAPTGLITITDRVYVHANASDPSGTYVYGGTCLSAGNWQFGVMHVNINDPYHYCYPQDMNAFTFGDNEIATNLGVGAGGYGGGNNFGQVAAIWDAWFDETITLDPATSVVTYSVNGGPVITGTLTSPMPNSPLTLNYNSYGWWTGHYEKIDSVSVTQVRTATSAPSILPMRQSATPLGTPEPYLSPTN